jgi:hypothetical protein
MNSNLLTEEPPTHNGPICIGIALDGDAIQVTARASGREIGHGRFPSTPLGTQALLGFLTYWQSPLRLAIATAGAAALGLALTLGAPHGREVFLVSAHTVSAAPDLARYAERAI